MAECDGRRVIFSPFGLGVQNTLAEEGGGTPVKSFLP
jgi:hypothetical protein